MTVNLGKINMQLGYPSREKIESLVSVINENIKPPERLSEDDLYIRAMYIVSEEVNSYGGKFHVDEMYRLKELIVDSPVIIGHRKDKLPIGRNFHAEVVTQDNKSWVKSYFYWLKNTVEAEDLKEKIDGGVIKECSLGFTFLFPECSICGKDIRLCHHEPFRSYSKHGRKQACYYYYRQIDKVLETSLVYRGAVPNTSISKVLQPFKRVSTLDEIPLSENYMITPHYDGLDVIINVKKNSISIKDLSGKKIDSGIANSLIRDSDVLLKDHFGQLIGYRGKERCTLMNLKQYLAEKPSSVKRVELCLFPSEELFRQKSMIEKNEKIKILRSVCADKDSIDKAMLSIMTKDGVRIWTAGKLPPYHPGFQYKNTEGEKKSRDSISLRAAGNSSAIFNITEDSYIIERFHYRNFLRGRRFVMRPAGKKEVTQSNNILFHSRIINENEQNRSRLLALDNRLISKIHIQPVIINGKNTLLVYCSN